MSVSNVNLSQISRLWPLLGTLLILVHIIIGLVWHEIIFFLLISRIIPCMWLVYICWKNKWITFNYILFHGKASGLTGFFFNCCFLVSALGICSNAKVRQGHLKFLTGHSVSHEAKKNGMKVFFPVIPPLSISLSLRYSPAPLLVLLRWSFHRLPHTLSNPLPAQFLGAQWLNPPTSNLLLKRGDLLILRNHCLLAILGKNLGSWFWKGLPHCIFKKVTFEISHFPKMLKLLTKVIV